MATEKPDKPSKGFDNPAIRITSAQYEQPEFGEDGKPLGNGVWIVGAAIEAADGSRMTTERFTDLDAETDEYGLEAAIAERWGI